MHVPHKYPTDLSELEIDLGFRLLQVEALGEMVEQSLPAVAVVRILSPSRILLKTKSGYELKVFGDCGIPMKKRNPIWNSASTTHGREIINAELFLHEYDLGLHPGGLNLVKECPFTWKEIRK